MKQMFTKALVAVAAIAMMSCSQEDAFDVVSANGTESDAVSAVEFTTYLGRVVQGRATITNTSSIQASGFGVFASSTGSSDFSASATPNFMYNQKVTYGNNTWTYSPLKYWPATKGEKVSFFAYAPYASEESPLSFSNNTATGAPTITVSYTDFKNTVDLVAAAQLNKTASVSEDGTASKVDFTLQHVMTRLGITANVSEDIYSEDDTQKKTYVFVRDVKFKNPAGENASQFFYSGGTYTFPSADQTTGSWGSTTAAQSSVALTLNTATQNLGEKVTAYPGNTYGASVKLAGTAKTSLFSESAYLFLIPVAQMTAGAIEADITYDIVTIDNALAGGASVTSATKTVKVPATCALAQGEAYTLNFTIHVHGVELSATVSDWDSSVTEQNVEVKYSDEK